MHAGRVCAGPTAFHQPPPARPPHRPPQAGQPDPGAGQSARPAKVRLQKHRAGQVGARGAARRAAAPCRRPGAPAGTAPRTARRLSGLPLPAPLTTVRQPRCPPIVRTVLFLNASPTQDLQRARGAGRKGSAAGGEKASEEESRGGQGGESRACILGWGAACLPKAGLERKGRGEGGRGPGGEQGRRGCAKWCAPVT